MTPSGRLRRRRRCTILATAVLGVVGPRPALAAGTASTVQPVFVRTPQASGDRDAQRAFEAACRRQALSPALVLELAAPPAPRAPAALEQGIAAMDGLRFQDALSAFDAAAGDAVLTGGAGLSSSQLADIYLFRAIVRHKLQPAQTARAWEDYVRAATLNPERVLDPGRFPPAAIATWNRAATEVQRRGRGTLIVRAPAGAAVFVDARAPLRSPALVPGLSHGEHLIRVEEPGRWPWAASVPLAGPSLEMEVPFRSEISLDDGSAADVARRRQARFALVAQQRAGLGEPLLELRLVEAASRLRKSGALVRLAEAQELAAAVDRLTDEARVVELGPRVGGSSPLLATAPAAPPGKTGFGKLGISLAVVTALAAGIAAGLLIGRGPGETKGPSGFSTTLDLPGR